MSIRNKILENEKKLIYLIDIFTFVYLISVYIFAGAYEHWVQSYSNIIALFYMFLLGCYAYLYRDNIFSLFSLLYVPFLCICGVSFIWTWDRPYCVKLTIELCAMFVLCILMYNYLISSHKTDYFILGLYVGGICLMLGTVLYYGIPDYIKGFLAGERMGHNILGNLNDVGIHAAYSSLIALYYCIYKNKWLNMIPSLLLMLFAFGTGSRKVVALLFIGIFMLLFLRGGLKFRLFSVGAVICLVLLFLYLPLFSGIKERVFSMFKAFSGGKTDSSMKIRIGMLNQAFIQFKKTPVLGIGLGSSHVLLKQTMNRDTYTHNNYAELATILGSIGFLLWYSHYLYPVRTLLKAIRQKKDIGILVLTFMVMGMVTHVASVEYRERFQILMVMYFYCCKHELDSDEKNIAGMV